MSAVANAKRQASAADDGSPTEPAEKKVKAGKSELCAGMEAGTKVGDGKEVEEFRNYEDSDRHSVRRRIVVDLARQAARFARVSGKLS